MADDAALDIVEASRPHADGFDAGDLKAPAARRLAVLTCMDARIDPRGLLGLRLGDAHVVRNAGGRATDDAVRSLMISTRLLGTRQVVVIHHTDCGNVGTDDGLAERLAATGLEDPPRPLHATEDLERTLRGDVDHLRSCGLLADGVTVEGAVYDVSDGRLRVVEPA